MLCLYPQHLRRLADENCSNHGQMNGSVCECDIGLLFLILVILSYHGDTCSESCEGLREEDDEVYECSGYGDCELTDGKYACKCDDYAFGPDCSQVCPESYRDEDDNVIICSGYGTCSFDGTAKCVCNTGYYGEDCSKSCPGLITQDDKVIECSGHGQCVSDDDMDTYYCDCEASYSGQDCSLSCPGQIEKDGILVSCSGNGECDDGTCVCDPGFYGETCDQHCPGLTTINGNVVECNGHGTCDPSSLTCTCANERWDPTDCGCVATTCGDHGSCQNQTCVCDEKWGNWGNRDVDLAENSASSTAIMRRTATGTACATSGSSIGIRRREGKCDCVFEFYGEHCENRCSDSDNCTDHGVCIENGARSAGMSCRQVSVFQRIHGGTLRTYRAARRFVAHFIRGSRAYLGAPGLFVASSERRREARQ